MREPAARVRCGVLLPLKRMGWEQNQMVASPKRGFHDGVYALGSGGEHTVFVVGIDLSLQSTGIAAFNLETREMFTTAVTSSASNEDNLFQHARRARRLAADIIAHVDTFSPELVVIESAYFNTGDKDSSAHRRAGLWWMVVAALDERYPLAEVTPASLKKFVTGTGKATKTAMELAIAAEFGAETLYDPAAGARSANDLADAAGLAAMGGYAAGICSMPRTAGRNATIGKVRWPHVSENLASFVDQHPQTTGG